MKESAFTIEFINYIPGVNYSEPFNTKILYKNSTGTTFLAYCFVDFWNRKVHFCTKKQFKETTLVKGFVEYFSNLLEENNYYLHRIKTC
jgi:hypothetical protein